MSKNQLFDNDSPLLKLSGASDYEGGILEEIFFKVYQQKDRGMEVEAIIVPDEDREEFVEMVDSSMPYYERTSESPNNCTILGYDVVFDRVIDEVEISLCD